MVHWKLIIKRILRRFKYTLQWKELLSWEYESCDNCGHCFKICWSAKDELWNLINGSEDGCLCIDCFIEKGKRKGVMVNKSEIECVEIFNPCPKE